MIEALRERDTLETIAHKWELHPNQITSWKKEFIDNAPSAFQKGADAPGEKKQQEAEKEKLYAQIGQLKVENDWLKKKLQ